MKNDILFDDGKYKIKLDKKHGYYRLDPVPSLKELRKYYNERFYSQAYSRQINDSSKKVHQEEDYFFQMQYDDLFEIIEKRVSGKKIIDIGCGYGDFLKYCQKKGYDGFGLDPAQDAVDSARKAGINVIKADIENLKDVIKEKYDVVVMLNVFEHLREPYKTLKIIKNYVLKDHGLLIIRVPNEFNKLQVIANQEYNLKSWWISAPQHINYFSVPQLVKLVNRSGFKVFLKEASFPLEIFILFGEQYVGHPKIGKTIHKKRVLFEKTLKKHDNDFKRNLFRSFAEQGIGRDIIVYVEKK